MTEFTDAVVKWNNKKETYLNSIIPASNKPGKDEIAPRAKIAYSIPKQYEKEIHEIIKDFRKKADEEFIASGAREEAIAKRLSERKRLAIEWEGNNPAPRYEDFQH